MLKQLAVSLGLLTISGLSHAADLQLNITGIKDIKGDVFIAVYDSEAAMHKTKTIWRSQMVKVVSTELSHTFTDVPIGDYAITVFHDLDGNQQLNTNFIGIPKEPYGFSNNPSMMGPPKYDKLRFPMSDQDTSVTIRID